jgi:hypothetical protein
MRKFLLAFVATVVAVLGLMLPATASADTTTAVRATEVSAAADEIDVAVAGTLPPRSQLTCHSVPAVEICYENFRGGSLYRQGICVNSLGKGKWGHCNKNYAENSVLNGFPCIWNRSAGNDAVCNPNGWRFQ